MFNRRSILRTICHQHWVSMGLRLRLASLLGEKELPKSSQFECNFRAVTHRLYVEQEYKLLTQVVDECLTQR